MRTEAEPEKWPAGRTDGLVHDLNDPPIDLATRQVDVVWQGCANEVTPLLTTAPPYVLNVTGPEPISAWQAARWMADGGPPLGKPTKFERRDGRF
ncbi:hypothetical protein [Sinosporangium siamense]|uniref:Uncharacterized protein n=1 Tax=Sinosporangium siamense TaxID=1367973 RepID=A0A919RFW8_9ACTN|nr:hypothetical protein [Sinosporangium siamense]GII92977.1 hypothetical protein Ssi02_32080 [Sinosporangium siamense]